MNRFTEQIIKRWCRRGDSNPHELPHTPLKRARLPVPPLRLVREGCQKIARRGCSLVRYFFVGFGEAVMTVEIGVGVGSAALAGADCGVGVGVDCGSCSGTPDCSTELVPLIAGNARLNAMSMKAAAAPIVI